MALFLVQHGKSLPEEQDPERGLSSEGIADVERIAAVARGYGVNVAIIKHSGKKRARQTAEIFAAALRPEKGVEEAAGLNPLDDLTAFAAAINNEDNVMLGGHLPFMERLTSYLIVGSSRQDPLQIPEWRYCLPGPGPENSFMVHQVESQPEDRMIFI
jgi:phosphohistidine phosphatase